MGWGNGIRVCADTLKHLNLSSADYKNDEFVFTKKIYIYILMMINTGGVCF